MALTPDRRFSQEQVRAYQDGEAIFAEGDSGRELYVIQEGRVVIRKRTEKGELELAVFEKGDFFGDMALLQGIPRFAGAYARGETRLLILQPGGFLLKIRRDPTFAFEMLQQLSFRLKISNERLLALLQSSGMPLDKAQALLDSPERPPQ